jgi:hypothetical protein
LRAGRVSLREFLARLKEGSDFLHDIQIHKVLVVDHLGRNIPVPIVFCSSWKVSFSVLIYVLVRSRSSGCKVFHYIIKGYCKDRYGDRYVQRGDYELIHPNNGQIISRSQFTTMVEPGSVFEISIILRQNLAFWCHRRKCPRCSHINLSATVTNGWTEWKVHPSSFSS